MLERRGISFNFLETQDGELVDTLTDEFPDSELIAPKELIEQYKEENEDLDETDEEAIDEIFGGMMDESIIINGDNFELKVTPYGLIVESDEQEKIDEIANQIEEILDSEDVEFEKEENYHLMLEDLEEFLEKDIENAIGSYSAVFVLEGEEGGLMVQADDNVSVRGDKEALEQLGGEE